jgi:hypothetical protein
MLPALLGKALTLCRKPRAEVRTELSGSVNEALNEDAKRKSDQFFDLKVHAAIVIGPKD